MICSVCEGVLVRQEGIQGPDREDLQFYAHHIDGMSLERSAQMGCYICLPFWEQFPVEEREQLRTISPAGMGPLAEEYGFRMTTALLAPEKKVPGSYGLSIHFAATWYTPLKASGFHHSRVMTSVVLMPVEFFEAGDIGTITSSNTVSEESWDAACTWVETCTRTHTACNVPNADGWLPTRLLDIGASEAPDSNIRVIFTAEEKIHGPYVSLSHCWGKAQVIQLKRETVAQFRESIPHQALPKTFQDAITITRRLGIRYLWIDSLCILQDVDDLSDWLREAASMSKVYAHAYCNISAAAATDGSKGLFVDRDPAQQRLVRVKLLLEGIHARKGSVDCYIIDDTFWTNSVGECPLNRRAWVLQERWLAPRVLHFGQKQLLWECCELDACELFPKALPQNLTRTVYTGFKIREADALNKKQLAVRSPYYEPELAYYRLWGNLIGVYSEAKLTKPIDKLLAVSGLAKHFSTLLQDEYVVGMWRRYLASELLWWVDDRFPSVRPEMYRAPSFSWASVDGKINFSHSTAKDIFIRVEEVHLEHVTNDTTGLATGGHIKVRGVLRPFKYVFHPGVPGQTEPIDLKRWQVIVNDMPVEYFSTERGITQSPIVKFDVNDIDIAVQNEAGSMFYLRSQGGRYDQYLLLLRVDQDSNTFRRIGVMFTFEPQLVAMLNYTPKRGSVMPGGTNDDGSEILKII